VMPRFDAHALADELLAGPDGDHGRGYYRAGLPAPVRGACPGWGSS
jgi:hypothetical protein